MSAAILLLYQNGFYYRIGSGLWEFYDSSNLLPDPSAAIGPVDFLQIAVFVVLALGSAWWVVDIPRNHLKLTLVGAALLLVPGLSFTLALYGVYFEPFSGVSAVLASSALAFVYSQTRQGQRKKVLHAVLGPRVSPEHMLDLIGSNGKLPLDPRRIEVSVLTCRVFNHANLMRELEPDDLVELSNLFLKNAVEHLLARDAYVDQSRPDCVRAFFGLGDSQNHAADACRAALELDKRVHNVNLEGEGRWFRTLAYGIGVSSGEITAGVFGSRRDVFFSGLGHDVGFSRRLCALNQSFGSRILLGARTYLMAKEEVEVRPMEMVYIEDEDVTTEVYELIAQRGELDEHHSKTRDAFWQGVIYYREGRCDLALEQFGEARMGDREDPPLDYFVSRAQEELVHAAGNPEQEEEDTTLADPH
ncbi:MAG: adenylate/guanylate cyclase domain-containing protein [Verrucomicrobiales bacterium]